MITNNLDWLIALCVTMLMMYKILSVDDEE